MLVHVNRPPPFSLPLCVSARLFDRETFLSRHEQREGCDRAPPYRRQQVGRSRIVRAPFIEIAGGRLDNPPCRPQAIVLPAFSKIPGNPAGYTRDL